MFSGTGLGQWLGEALSSLSFQSTKKSPPVALTSPSLDFDEGDPAYKLFDKLRAAGVSSTSIDRGANGTGQNDGHLSREEILRTARNLYSQYPNQNKYREMVEVTCPRIANEYFLLGIHEPISSKRNALLQKAVLFDPSNQNILWSAAYYIYVNWNPTSRSQDLAKVETYLDQFVQLEPNFPPAQQLQGLTYITNSASGKKPNLYYKKPCD